MCFVATATEDLASNPSVTADTSRVSRVQFQYTPKTKYQHSFFDENGVYWPSTSKSHHKTPAEKSVAAAAKKEKKDVTGRRLVESYL